MRNAKTLMVALVAVFAFSAIAASVAMASPPEFTHCEKVAGVGKYETKAKCEAGTPVGSGLNWEVKPVPAGSHIEFTDKSGKGTLNESGITVKCEKDKSKGEITTAKTVKAVFDTFEECVGKDGAETCPVNSPGEGAGTIKTEELEGELGVVLASEAASETGLDLKAVSTSGVIVKFEDTCLPKPGEVTGSIIGEVNPISTTKVSSTAELKYAVSLGEQKIKKFIAPAKKDVLRVFGAEATEETTDILSFPTEDIGVN
jgi:hypothetical protein